MRVNVKPLTHWIIYRGYKVRFTGRAATAVTGILTTPTGTQALHYDPTTCTVQLPGERITINEYGWELSKEVIHEQA
ncbi:MAG: hypothetical protein M3Q45_02140 [Chloroflexota bacterium]|nr:hypothetical protein [Chloroflexota bacterium]